MHSDLENDAGAPVSRVPGNLSSMEHPTRTLMLGVDSGAAATVTPRSILKDYHLSKARNSENGVFIWVRRAKEFMKKERNFSEERSMAE